MNFKYESYNELLIELGQVDYIIELNELANRELKSKFEESSDKEALLEEICKKHKIIVNYDSLETIQGKMTLSYIAFVYHTVEAFFYKFKDEYNKIQGYSGEEKLKFISGKTKLQQLLNYFEPRFNAKDKIDEHLIDTFNYYHQLRVKFSHPKTTSTAEIETKYVTANKHRVKLGSEFNLVHSPKKISEIDFEDFFLFTRVSKEIARLFSTICLPTPAKIIVYLKLERFKKYSDEKRIKTAIQNELVQKFRINIDYAEDYINEIYKEI